MRTAFFLDDVYGNLIVLIFPAAKLVREQDKGLWRARQFTAQPVPGLVDFRAGVAIRARSNVETVKDNATCTLGRSFA